MRLKARNVNQLRIGAVLSYVNMAIGSLIPMFYTPWMLSLLGKEEYGLYRLAGSVTSYLSLISLGIGSAIVRYYTKYIAEGDKEGEANIFGLFNIFYIVIASIAAIVGIVISFNVQALYGESLSSDELSEMRILILVFTATTSFNFLCTPHNSMITAHEKFIFSQIINIIMTTIIPVVNIIVLLFGFKSLGMAFSSLIINVLVRIIYAIYVRTVIGMKPKYNNMPKHLIKEILIFSFWIFVSNVVNQLYNTTDTLIIGMVPALATIGVAVYNVGATFNTMMMNFSLGMLSVLTPKVNKLVFSKGTREQLTNLLIRVGRLQCYIVSLVCCGFVAFGRQFITLWVGESYLDAYWVAIVTMIPASIPLIQNVAMSIIIAQNKHRFRSLVYLAIAIVNVVGTYFAVNQFGIVGAAVVTGVANIIGTGFIMNWYYWKKIDLDIPRFWKNVGKLFILPIVLCIITLLVSRIIIFDSWPVFFAGVIVFVLIYFSANWCFIMNDYEKDIFRQPVLKIKNKFSKR